VGTGFMAVVGVGFYSSMVLLALYTQKLLGYDAWTSGLVLAPRRGQHGGPPHRGRLVARVDQRPLLAMVLLNGIALRLMANLTLGVDYWNSSCGRASSGLPGVHLRAAQHPGAGDGAQGPAGQPDGGVQRHPECRRSCGRRPRLDLPRPPQPVPSDHAGEPRQHLERGYGARLKDWSDHLPRPRHRPVHGAERALAMVYRDHGRQAQVLAYADEFWLLSIMSSRSRCWSAHAPHPV